MPKNAISHIKKLIESENGHSKAQYRVIMIHMKRDDIFYQAMLARDNRFDGKFYIGVKTTGIYCRPVCPAKPKRENVEFFPSYFAAEKKGYRPCMRCRPESAPGSPVWIGTSAMVKRALRLIQSPQHLKFNEEEFAEIFGVSSRHLRRVFKDEIGKTPKQLSSENRLNLARKLLTETSLTITEIAYSSGFNSIRRFNDAFKLRFKKKPSEIRRLKIIGPNLRLSLSYRPPYDFKSLLESYKIHKIGKLENVTEDTYSRILSINNKIGKLTVTNDSENCRLIVEIDFPDTSEIQFILNNVRSMFDLDSDPVVIANALEIDFSIKPLLKKYKGLRLPSGWDPFEIAVSAILGQLVSIQFGRTLVEDLIEMLGKEYKGIKLFPTPEAIAQSDLVGLRTTKARKRTLRNFSEMISNGKLSLDPAQDIDTFMTTIKSVPGIGPWTAEYIALKALKHTDAFPETDLIISRAIKKHNQSTFLQMSPWRGYLTVLLWKEYYKGKNNE